MDNEKSDGWLARLCAQLKRLVGDRRNAGN